VHFLTLLLYGYIFVVTFILALFFWPVLFVSLFLLLFTFSSARWLYLCFINRNQLIEYVQENLS